MINLTPDDLRYRTLTKGFNLRWPATDAQAAARIELCESMEDVATALQHCVNAGSRPTIRSGGHCYEDFVSNNPGGTVLDLSLMSGARVDRDGCFRIAAGTQNWNGYQDLYKRHGVTLPGGSCYSVGAGGHIAGGGYGLLSRLHGLTVDWLTGVEIVTVDAQGKVLPRSVDAKRDPDLFRACRGAGGGNFGVVTEYAFAQLPRAPSEVAIARVAFDWADMNEARFSALLRAYGEYWETRGTEPDTWGLFSLLSLNHRSAGQIVLLSQFCNPDGTCRDLTVLSDFLERFQACAPVPIAAAPPGDGTAHQSGEQLLCSQSHSVTRYDWLTATQLLNGSGPNQRGKYKSAYMKHAFTTHEIARLYTSLTQNVPGLDLSQSLVQVNSYGGAINRTELAGTTAVAQRASIMKLQYQTYWRSPQDDAAHVRWLGDLYRAVYSAQDGMDRRYDGTPFPGERYEGCYINYPDADMLAYPFWPHLYYGDGGLYAFLQDVKRQYDPNNIFHHAMSIRPGSPRSGS